MAEKDKKSPQENLPRSIKRYFWFASLLIVGVAYANKQGWYPTYGIFSGENSMHSSSHYGGHGGGYYGIHGK